MPTIRSLVFANHEIYHVFNRGIDHRDTFTQKVEWQRMVDLLSYYRFAKLALRYSQFYNLESSIRKSLMQKIQEEFPLSVRLLAYCLMPNHFHLLLRQEMDKGVSSFVSNISNSYTKYFNTKHERKGPLFEGVFKAVHIETDEQLIHVSRYIHLNPVSSFIIPRERLFIYPWSSIREYIQRSSIGICDTSYVFDHFQNVTKYKNFLEDQIEYAQSLEKIKHLVFD